MIVVGTTLAAFVMDQPDTWSAWLRNAAAIQASHPAGVRYFAAVEVDARGIEPFAPLLDRLDAPVGVAYRVGDPTVMRRWYEPRWTLEAGVADAVARLGALQ